jgi:hypothetical protein
MFHTHKYEVIGTRHGKETHNSKLTANGQGEAEQKHTHDFTYVLLRCKCGFFRSEKLAGNFPEFMFKDKDSVDKIKQSVDDSLKNIGINE